MENSKKRGRPTNGDKKERVVLYLKKSELRVWGVDRILSLIRDGVSAEVVSAPKTEIMVIDDKKAKIDSLRVIIGQSIPKEAESVVKMVLVEQPFGETDADRRMMRKLKQEDGMSLECQRFLDRLREKILENDSQVNLVEFNRMLGDM